MKFAFALLGIASLATGLQYDGYRVKFGWSDALADKEYFFSLPRVVSDAEAKGWRRTERPPGPLPELRMYCSTGKNVCPLYDTAGFIAGLQVAIPVEGYEYPPFWVPEKKFVKWVAKASHGEPEKEYWTATQFYVSEESLKAGAGPTIENGATLQDGGVWVAGPDNRLMRIPSTEGELNTTSWKKQNCIPNMGIHYHYNMTPDLKCEDLFPWFATTTDTDLAVVGFQVIGRIPKQNPDWFEKVPKDSAPITIPLAPQCLYDNVDKYGVISLHIYFIDKPWTIKCKDGDSIKKPGVVARLMMNSAKYANKIVDEVKNVFG
ncbi:PREDICTED: uncharacterized protein LOC106120358 [Papilio xuthus]|uniref:Uncharacterized protein LOC106120358 n=1 Tax=Papilio xuthus TaxID=66420 RepID=A0AAJ6ZF75_PAPXU|nr:PREDICTED: uncharacterized protein LOC106120358 [Papilio xuthus]